MDLSEPQGYPGLYMQTATVISYFTEREVESEANHRRYALSQGADHRVIDVSDGPQGPRLRALQRYEALSAAMEDLPAGQHILLLSESAAIVADMPLTSIVGDRDMLLVSTSSEVPQVNVQFWRNTPCSREVVRDLVGRCRLGGGPFVSEASLLERLPCQPWHQTVEGVIPVMHAGPNLDPRWSVLPTFALSIENSGDPSAEIGLVPRFRHTLIRHINECNTCGKNFFDFGIPAPEAQDDRSTINAGRPVAFVTLYTPEIAGFGRIAESNFSEYCLLHGHTLHVHRGIPREIGLSGAGNWTKPWLLHAYLAHHEWVIWLDADVLFADMDAAIARLLIGKDRLLTADVGQWPINSGVVGFRHTDANRKMLHDLMMTVASLPDRSSVYAGNGDQHYFIELLRQHRMLNREEILSWRAINTPWYWRDRDSYVVHYLGMWWKMREMMMRYDEAHRIGSKP
ncbi:galactosyl transferase GMA12/MNN10 domain protein [Burkholderia ubonensis]|uniref:galactosyl transferase GMA12/MNN10 domain protein n=1 Tax=Burkholderia ubonensis TaxID=101571 RepID=UPI0012FBE352|nr:galactosyl transferase GMA12/MNN10 domain protein [Burkholderia ubonensis]